MAKTYSENLKLTAARNMLFSTLLDEEQVRIHDALTLASGDYLPKDKMKKGSHIVFGGGGMTNNTHDQTNVTFETVGIGRVGARCGCVFKIVENSWVTDNALYVKDQKFNFNLDFLVHYLDYLNLNQFANTAAQPVISLKRISNVTLPLIPLNQQLEIVDVLNKVENGCSIANSDNHELGRLLKSINSCEGLSTELTHQLDLVKQLRQAFLREAMQGKMVPHNPNDEPASVLLEKIKAEKERLIEEKVIRKGKLQEAETLDELLFDIPNHWVWCKLDSICKNITDGTHQTPTYTKTGRMFLSAQNVKPFRFMPEEHKFVSEEAYQGYIKNRKPERGDLLIGRVGAGIGETAVIDQDLDFCIYVSLGLVQPFKEYVDSNYLAYVFNSPYGFSYAKGNISSKGGSAGNFNLGRIRSFLIPFPPLSEQQAIVAKLDELMQYSDELEASIKESQQQNELLLQQVLREALEPKEKA